MTTTPHKHPATAEKRASTRHDAYARTMRQARAHLSMPRRGLSRFVHARPVELISDIIGGSLLRPTAIVVGSTTALLITSIMYVIAKRYGYELAGSEFLVAFGFGWLAGIIIDYTRLLIRSVTKKRR